MSATRKAEKPDVTYGPFSICPHMLQPYVQPLISALKNGIGRIGFRFEYMQPEFIEAIAVTFEPDEP